MVSEDYAFNKREYQDHMKEARSQGRQENTLSCKICGKMVKNKFSLKSHVKLVHEKGSAKFPCDKCGKVLQSKGSFYYHSKALSCEDCGKQFTLPNSLNTHRLNHHMSFPKDCEDCGKFCGTKREAHKVVLPAESPCSTPRRLFWYVAIMSVISE